MSSHLPGNAPQSQCSAHLSTSGNNCRFGGCWRYIHTGWYTHRQMAGSDLNKWPYQQPLPLATFWSTFRRCLWLSTHSAQIPHHTITHPTHSISTVVWGNGLRYQGTRGLLFIDRRPLWFGGMRTIMAHYVRWGQEDPEPASIWRRNLLVCSNSNVRSSCTKRDAILG